MGNRVLRKLNYWQYTLGLEQHRLNVRRISMDDVSGEDGPLAEHLIGGRLFEGEIVIYTTRRLKEEDVVHELAHIRFPEMDETDIRRQTADLLVTRNAIFKEGTFGRERA